MKFLKISLFFYLFLCPDNGISQIRLLKHDWLVYDNESKQLFPFVKKNKENLPLHILVEKEEYKGLFLQVKSKEDISLYVNNKFSRHFKKDTVYYTSFDSIKVKDYSTLLSFYGKYNTLLIDSLAVVYDPKVSEVQAELNFKDALNKNYGKSYFALFLLLSGCLYVAFRNNYIKAFNQFINYQDLFFNFKAESSEIRSNVEGYYFAFVLIGSVFFSLACSGMILFLNKNDESRFLDFLLNFTRFIFITWFFYFLKFLVIRCVSWLFSINKFASLHFKVFVKIALMWSVSLVLLNLIGLSNIINFNEYQLNAFLFTSVFFLTLTSLKISILINQVSRISTLYLISYLCITEWLPYFVILKLYMVYFY